MKIDIEKNIIRVSKLLVSEYKSSGKGEIDILRHFENEYDYKTKKESLVFGCMNHRTDKFVSIDFGDMDICGSEFGAISLRIANKVVELLKINLNKNTIVYGTTKHWTPGGYYSSHSYDIYTNVTVVPLCKEFIKVNKRLVELNMPLIDVKKWTYGNLSGKRSSVFDKSVHYFAEDKNTCMKVLEYLKGKKKLNDYQIIESVDDSDMKHGIEYETEWYGSYRNYLKFTDSKNKVTNIF